MKILIIGSKGFIGSHCFNFFEKGFETWGCDIFTNYNERNFYLSDTINSIDHNLFRSRSFDVCINCAGAASVPDSWISPQRDYELNTNLVFKLLDNIRVYNPSCRFINISSAAVYGTPISLPVSESSLIKPLSPYGKHKIFSEMLCSEFHDYYKIKTCSLRIFSAYGPGLKKQIFWDWYVKSRLTSEIVLPGTGKESRDYIYIDDILNSLKCIVDKAEYTGESYNVGSGNEFVIKDVAELFFKKIGWNGVFEFNGEVRAGEPIHWQADISKISQFGFKPLVSLEEGLDKYLTWIKNLQLD